MQRLPKRETDNQNIKEKKKALVKEKKRLKKKGTFLFCFVPLLERESPHPHFCPSDGIDLKKNTHTPKKNMRNIYRGFLFLHC